MNRTNTIMKFQTIDQVETISKDDFIKNYLKKRKPLLLKGYAKNWKDFDKWNLDYIKNKAGNQIVPLYDSKPADPKKSSDTPATHMNFDTYIDLIKSEPSDLRIFFFIIKDKIPELLQNFTFPDLGLKYFKQLPTLFFGGSEAKVLMHYDVDMTDFIHFQFHGDKRILLFAPDQSKALYKVPLSVHTINDIDYDNPQYDKFPALKNAIGYDFVMNHGDALFIPRGYWHYNRYLEAGFSMSLRAFPNEFLQVMNTVYHVFIMRYTDKLMRKIFQKKWIDFKEKWAVKKTHKYYQIKSES